MSVAFATVFACPGSGCSPPLPRKRCCGTTAPTPATCGISPSSSTHWHPGRKSAPGYLEQCRQLTQARAEHPWLATGSQMAQQQALRDFAQAMAAFLDPHNRAGRQPGARPDGTKASGSCGRRGSQWDVRRVSRRVGQVRVPKVGWVRFRWSRPVPQGVKSYRVTCDRVGRWHVAFAAVPEQIPGPGTARWSALTGASRYRCPVERGVAARSGPDRARACATPTAGAQAGQGEARLAPPQAGQGRPSPGCAPARPTAARTGPRRRPRHRAPV